MNGKKQRRPSSPRQYATTACIACRRRKIKCDNGRPKCSNCRIYDTACVLGEDGRRSSSTVKAITALSTRLSGLEGLLAGHQANVTRAQGTSPPAASVPSPQNLSITFGDPAQQTQLPLLQANPEQDTSGISMELGNNDLSSYMSQQPDYWNNLDEGAEIMDWSQMELHFRRGNEDYPQHSDPQYPTSAENQMGDAQSVSRPSNSLGTMNMDGSSVALPQPTSITSYTKSTNNLSDGGGVADPVVETEVTQFLTTRFGRLQYAEDGQIRYFGSTSNMHMFPNGLQSMFQPVVRTLRDHGETSLKAHNLKWPGDPLYEEHLTNLFFAWHNPFLKEVDRKVYQREKEVYYSGKETSLFSPTLENAILAMGASYSSYERPDINHNPSEFFALRAKNLIEIEMDCPKLATLQALMVISAHEGANGRDSRGWMCSGVIVQLVTDMGLHLDLAIPRKESDTDADISELLEIRKNLFWAAYAMDTLWSTYNGRPSTIYHIERSVDFPTSLSKENWEYYSMSNEFEPTPNIATGSIAFVARNLAELVLKIGKINATLYTGIPGVVKDPQAFLASMDTELRTWKENLPSCFQVVTSSPGGDYRRQSPSMLPAVLQLLMIHQHALILLHRPFITQIDSSYPSVYDSRAVCTQAASECCQLITMYRQQYSLRRIHIIIVHVIMTTCLIHAYDRSMFSGNKGRRAQEQLLTCIQALGEMGQTFESSARSLEVVMSLKREWQDQKLQRGKSESVPPGFDPINARM